MDFQKQKQAVDILKLFEDRQLVKICAPMVRYSKLQFRTLVREYGCDLCYTPMILADSFCQSDKARRNEFTTNLLDSPLVVQFAANTVHDFVGASYMVSPYCDGVDLNCGCPQHWAKQMGVGCAMLNKPELLADLVTQCRNRIAKPFTVSVKLRILKDVRKMIEICKQIEKAGASYLSVHARVPTQHTGDINMEVLKLIVQNVNCPVVGNGGVNNWTDCLKLQEESGCKGVMIANGLLTNPQLFIDKNCTTQECIQKWLDICYNSTLNSASFSNISNKELAFIPERPPNLTFQCFHHHLVFMLEKVLPKSKRRLFNNLQYFKDVLQFLNETFQISPQIMDAKAFGNQQVLNLNYEKGNELYNELKLCSNNPPVSSDECCLYDPLDGNGRFFNSKISTEFEDYGLTTMFIGGD